jgi:ABC-2 type transport system permease protein
MSQAFNKKKQEPVEKMRDDSMPALAAHPTALDQLKRYSTIYGALWRNSVVREMSFKSNFLLWIFVELLWFGLQLSFIGVIYLHTDHIGDWTKWQVVLLIGASHFIQQIFQAFFLVNCTQLSELIRTGKLDFMLLLPVNTRFLISLRQVDLGGFVNGLMGVAVMAYAAKQLHLIPGAATIFGFLLLSLAGILIHYSLMFLLASISFWTVRAQGVVWGYYNLFNISRMPDSAFQGFFKAFFTFAIPMLLVANVPAKLITQKLQSPWEMVLLIATALFCFTLSELGWRFAMRHYTSASS